jgi:magnesium transporter
LPEQFDHVTLVVPKLQPLANVTLGKLMLSPRDVLLTAIVEGEFCVIPVLQDEADVAYALNQYPLIFAPVVDESHRLTGMITIEDAMEMLEDENQEDILRLAGVTDNNLSDWVLETIKQRPPWLVVNLVSAILASLVIAQFEATITQLVALVVLMPIVASMGGNAATQTFKAAVQALSTHDLTPSNLWRVVRREAFVGLLNGVVFAVVMGCVGIICSGSSALDYVVLRATLLDFIVAGLAGTLVTVVLDRSGVDSALGLVLLSPRSRSRMWLGFSPFWVWLHGCCHE